MTDTPITPEAVQRLATELRRTPGWPTLGNTAADMIDALSARVDALTKERDALAENRDKLNHAYREGAVAGHEKALASARAEIARLAADVSSLMASLSGELTESERLRGALRQIDVGDGWAALIARAALATDQKGGE